MGRSAQNDETTVSEQLAAEVVIVGSGVAGALCAYRLALSGVKVLVLEAGPRITRESVVQAFKKQPQLDLSAGFPNPHWAPRPDWGSGADPYIDQAGSTILHMEYLRVVGGTTWHWSGSALRLRPEDFGMYSRFRQGVDWPITYDQLETDYAEAEKELGVSGDPAADPGLPRSTPFPLPPVPPSYAEKWVAERLHSAGLSFTARPVARNTLPFDGRSQCAGFGTCSPICPTGAQYSAMVHVDKAQRLGVRVLENCRVDRLHADTSGQIRSVAFTRSDGSTGTSTRRRSSPCRQRHRNPSSAADVGLRTLSPGARQFIRAGRAQFHGPSRSVCPDGTARGGISPAAVPSPRGNVSTTARAVSGVRMPPG